MYICVCVCVCERESFGSRGMSSSRAMRQVLPCSEPSQGHSSKDTPGSHGNSRVPITEDSGKGCGRCHVELVKSTGNSQTRLMVLLQCQVGFKSYKHSLLPLILFPNRYVLKKEYSPRNTEVWGLKIAWENSREMQWTIEGHITSRDNAVSKNTVIVSLSELISLLDLCQIFFQPFKV